ncbi:MAG: hypothetical protein H6797_04325 [Candidatus Nomurabacteria bacterium]|nr:MAG: hypothetical protein H6797_04325 [Candidatus Nomurabacteria bacterium]
MSSVEEYAYTFRMIIPEKSLVDLESISEKMMKNSAEGSTPMVVSTIDDYLTISINEDTEFPDERLPYAVMLAKTALREYGIERPMFINAYATRMNGEDLADIHEQIVIETEEDYIINLTDELMQHELNK